jgi:hypothetical protein
MLKSLTDLALTQFIVVYDDIMQERGLTSAMKGEELLPLMQAAIYQDQEEGKPSACVEKPKPKAKPSVEKPKVKTTSKPKPEIEVSEDGRVTSKFLKSRLPTSRKLAYKTSVNGEEIVKTFDLPYLPDCVDYSGTCAALGYTSGLFAPCLTAKAKGMSFCKSCMKKELTHGTIEKRRQSILSGKHKEITFGTYLAKREIPREEAEKIIEETFEGKVKIPEFHWKVDDARAKHKVKGKISTSSDEGSETEETVAEKPKAEKKVAEKPEALAQAEEVAVKKRGRPSKKTKEVEEVQVSPVKNDWLNEAVSEEVEESDADERTLTEAQHGETVFLTDSDKKSLEVFKKLVENLKSDEVDDGITRVIYKGEVYYMDTQDRKVYTSVENVRECAHIDEDNKIVFNDDEDSDSEEDSDDSDDSDSDDSDEE